MKKTFFTIAVIAMILGPVITVSAIESGSKSAWLSAKEASKTAKIVYNQAQLDYTTNKTPENQKAVIDTGKEFLQKALNEVEEWLLWKNTEAQNDPRATDAIRSSIASDVEKNLSKINNYRQEVNEVTTQIELGVETLKLIGGYLELLTDVARNVGALWVQIGNNLLSQASDSEAKLREAAMKLNDNADIIAKLDQAKQELSTAKTNVNSADAVYKQVKLPGQPLIKFGEGNSYLTSARSNLLSAQQQMYQAFLLISAK